jgi:hypothetical protein
MLASRRPVVQAGRSGEPKTCGASWECAYHLAQSKQSLSGGSRGLGHLNTCRWYAP